MDADREASTRTPTSGGDDNNWGPRLVDEETQDPEELRVFYAAVESFSYVPTCGLCVFTALYLAVVLTYKTMAPSDVMSPTTMKPFNLIRAIGSFEDSFFLE